MIKSSQKYHDDVAIATLQANTHGRKKKLVSVITLAEACSHLVKRYGTYEKVSKLVKTIKPEMVREFYEISLLPQEVKRLIANEEILIDAARRIPTVGDKQRQIEVSRAIAGLKSHDARAVISYLANNPKTSVKKGKDIVLKSKNEQKNIHMMVLDLDNDKYLMLKKFADEVKTNPNNLLKSIIDNWLSHNSNKAKKVGQRHS